MNQLSISILSITLFLTGCTVLKPIADDPVRYLLESPLPARTPRSSAPVVAIARPSLPPYLERSELVTRTADGRVIINEEHLWSEPLDAAISRVIAESLRRSTGSTNIQPVGSFITKDYSSIVEIRIDRFDPVSDQRLLLECTWKTQPLVGGDTSSKAFRTEVDFDGLMPGRVKAMNVALGRLSREIAKSF